MTKKWNYQPPTNEQMIKQIEIAQKFHLNPVICLALIQNGITEEQEIHQYLSPSLSRLHNPFEYPDMQKAVDRLNKALYCKEKILVQGDYDVDGITAVAAVCKFLKTFYIASHIKYLIPNRSETVGISINNIQYANSIGVTLIVLLDCGTKAASTIDYARTLGIDIIICDHHKTNEILPPAIAILNAQRKDSVYPYPHLSGCGVGFKFMQAFAYCNGIDSSELWKLLDLCVLSIAVDNVPLTGENRLLAIHGLQILNTNPCKGIKGLIFLCGLKGKKITMKDILHKIGPRINASGRMSEGGKAVDLLMENHWEKAVEKSKYIDFLNNKRRCLDRKTTVETDSLIKENPSIIQKKIIIIFNSNWHPGIISILAARLLKQYHKPILVVTEFRGILIGSARSFVGFDVLDALKSTQDLTEDFGGHSLAAGVTIRKENWELFKNRMNLYAQKYLFEDQTTLSLPICSILSLNDINQTICEDLNRMSPFGFQNPSPIFCSLSVKDTGNSKIVGHKKEHLQLELTDKSGKTIQAFAYSMHRYYPFIKNGKAFDICYTIEKNHYLQKIQLIIKDIRTRVPVFSPSFI